MDYFTQLREGHAIVRNLIRMARIAHEAPSYMPGGYSYGDDEEDHYEDEECWEPEENDVPHTRFSDAEAAAWQHPAAARILSAWGHRQDDPLVCYPDFIENLPVYGRTR
jgi:hypothetical protein